MKKSVLWTAAGVVSAAAVWAALNLPQRPPAYNPASLACTSTERFSPPGDIAMASKQANLQIQYPSSGSVPYIPRAAGEPVPTVFRTTLCLPLRSSQVFHWDGNRATITQETNVESFPLVADKTGRPVTLNITRQYVEKDAVSWMRRSVSYSRTIKPGDTFPL